MLNTRKVKSTRRRRTHNTRRSSGEKCRHWRFGGKDRTAAKMALTITVEDTTRLGYISYEGLCLMITERHVSITNVHRDIAGLTCL
jgi:hypothetical protein